MLPGATPLGVYALTAMPTPLVVTTITADKGSLTLTGKDVTLTATMVADKNSLTLTGKDVGLIFTQDQVPGHLVLTGRNATFTITMAVECGHLRLFAIDEPRLVMLGGSSGAPAGARGADRRRRTGLERPKWRKPPEPEAPAPLPVPPFKRPPLLEEARHPVIPFVEGPDGLLELQEEALLAQDLADIESYLDISGLLTEMDQDDEDAEDIAKVLALLD